MYAIDLSESAHGRLTLFTAAVGPPTLAYWAPAGLADVIEAAETQAARIASHARQRVPDRVPVTCVVTSRPIRQALMRQISVGQHDLVVVGSRGHGSVNSAVLGGRQPLHSSPQPGAGAGCPRRSLASELERSRRRWSGRSTTPEAMSTPGAYSEGSSDFCSWRVKSVVLLPRHQEAGDLCLVWAREVSFCRSSGRMARRARARGPCPRARSIARRGHGAGCLAAELWPQNRNSREDSTPCPNPEADQASWLSVKPMRIPIVITGMRRSVDGRPSLPSTSSKRDRACVG